MRVPSGLTALLFATFPLFLGGLAHFALPGERLRGPAALGMLVGFAGMATIFSQDFARLGGPRVASASAVMLLAPFASALGNVTVKRFGHGVHPISLNAGAMGLAAGVMGAAAMALERDERLVFDATSIGALLYLAIAGSLARKKVVPAGPGTLPTHTPLFTAWLVGVVLLVGVLAFVPVLALGPIVEHLSLFG